MSERARCRECGERKPRTAFKKSGGPKTRKTARRELGSDGRRLVCRACLKRRERRAKGATPRPVIAEVAALRRIGARGMLPRAVPPREQLRRLLRALLVARCREQGIALSSVEYRVRYANDWAFRAREIERTHRRKAVADWQADGTLTGDVMRRLFAAARRCPDCKRRMRSTEKSLDHIVPKSRGGAHSILNVRVICKTCNTRKQARMPDQLVLSRAG